MVLAAAQDCILWHLLPHLVAAKLSREATQFLPWFEMMLCTQFPVNCTGKRRNLLCLGGGFIGIYFEFVKDSDSAFVNSPCCVQ